MSDVMNADRYAAGIATAYGAAVQGGYTGTYAQFCAQQAQFAENAQAVEEAKQEVLSTVQTFENTTVPAAITQVQEEGTAQIQVVQDATAQQIIALQEEGLRQQAAVVEAAADQVEAARIQAQRSENAADAAEGYRDETQGLKNTFENTTVPAAVQTVQNAGAAQVQAVEQAGSDQVDAVELAGSTQVGNVNTAGTTQVGNVNQAGTTQVAAVAAEGAAQVQAVEDKGDEVIASIPSEYTQLSEDVDILKKNKAPVIVEEASGQLVSIVDGADGMLVKKLLVNVDPVQDLHGQDAPYPAGGGPNVIPPFTSETKNGATLTFNNGEVTISTVSGGASADTNFDITLTNVSATSGTMIYLCGFNPEAGNARLTFFIIGDNGNPQINLNSVNAYYSVQISSNYVFSKARIRVPAGIEMTNFKFKPYFQLGGTAPTAFTPYSNICPITGWTGANVTRTGKNIYPVLLTDENFSNNGGATHSKSNGELTINTINSSESCGVYVNVSTATLSSILRLLGDKQRTISFDAVASVSTPVRVTSGNSTLITVGTTKARYCVPSTGVNFNFYAISTASTIVVSNLQIEIGTTTESSYEPYTGNTISVTFPSSAGTVYGGNLDVTTGVLTVTDAQIASYAGEMLPGEWISDRDVYVAGTTPTTGAQVVYKLATPQTYQLTAQQMTTLLGSNNIWADTGDVEVEYCADTKLYIELLTQPTEDDMTANANIAANRFFMIGNNLYYSTSAIAAGATIIPGTNCTAISLADALNQLNT